jgi:LAO/AO transport system kinase
MNLAKSILEGDRLALARLLTRVENDDVNAKSEMNELFAHTGKSHLVGITGSPGTGKSSLANQLAKVIRKEKKAPRVAVVAVDPTSPFTGGAILGDRVRMRDLQGDEGIFIRSMASRGALGGIARTTAAMVQVLDAAGFGMILIETVGAGQAEVDIASLAHTTIVVETPGLGDDIQAIKAGILEIADILVINKADLPGVENAERALRMSIELAHPEDGEEGAKGWMVPVLRTQSHLGVGINKVVEAIRAHGEFLHLSGEWEKRDEHRLKSELENLIEQRLMEHWHDGVEKKTYLQLVEDMIARKISPYQAVEELVKQE